MRTSQLLASAAAIRPLGAGLMAGAAAAGAVWWAAKNYGRDRADQILDWDRITSIALRTAAITPPMSHAERAAAEADYREILREIAEPLSAYTGTDLQLPNRDVRALDRPEWIHANIANFRELLQPFEALYRDVASGSSKRGVDFPGLTAVGRLALSAEVGVLLGYLAQRVLGQYDISLLGAKTDDPGKLYFVEPNIQAVQLRLGLPRREFRTWLALHESTHAHEFEGHPWVRDYMNTTLNTYLNSMVGHLRESKTSLPALVAQTLDRLGVGGTLLEAMMTPYQRELVSRLQALMCMLEGYGNHVMRAVGGTMLPHFAEIEQRIEDRSRQKSRTEQLFLRITGLQMKLDQYRLGEAFIDQVEQARDATFLKQIWQGPEFLPSEAEVRSPDAWVERMERGNPPLAAGVVSSPSQG